MRKSLFITIEGSDGAGKSTQIKRIKRYLEQRGQSAIITREPGGTVIGEKIRQIILDKDHGEMGAVTETLLYAAARAQHVEEVIQPALDKGEHVICDRFIDSSIAYQGYGRQLGDCVSIVNAYAISGCLPDITFLLKLPLDVAEARIHRKNKDRIEMEDPGFHDRVFRGYQALEKQEPHRIIGIDGDRDVEEITQEILEHIERLLEIDEFSKN